MILEKMVRVNKQNPCPVCGKPDWCLVSADGTAVICPRIEDGSVKRCGDAGYLHRLENRLLTRTPRRITARVRSGKGTNNRFAELAEQYRQQLTEPRLTELSQSLGVSEASLRRLKVGFDGTAYTFPMKNETGRIIGIRRRFPNGSKAAVKGSRSGLFIPNETATQDPVLICEGPTDTAAGVDLGFYAIGRPSCMGGTDLLVRLARGHEVVIACDSDQPGRDGAMRLARWLAPLCPSVKIVCPGHNVEDLREWLCSGLTRGLLQKHIDAAGPVRLSVQSKTRNRNHGRR